jgi:hypothetical protein
MKIIRISQDADKPESNEPDSGLWIYQVCSYCNEVFGVKGGHTEQKAVISHGICPKCWEEELKKIMEIPQQPKK